MPTSRYAAYRNSVALEAATVHWLTDTIRAALCRGYTPNVATDAYLSDLGATVVASSAALAGKSIAAGVFDANDSVFTAVPAGGACTLVVLYGDTGTPATSPLIAVLDNCTGLPVTPTGADILLVFDNGADKVFAI